MQESMKFNTRLRDLVFLYAINNNINNNNDKE